jgi:hypothetical protein
MLRVLILAVLGGLLLCALCGTSPQSKIADADNGGAGSTKHQQMDVSPVVSSTTASELQPASFSQGTKDLPSVHDRQVVRTSSVPTLRHSLQASILLRI